MDPLELFYSWQSILCALSAIGLAKLVTTLIELRVTKEQYDKSRVLSRVVYPLLPIVAAMIFAVAVPLRPEPLLTYVAAHATGFQVTLSYAAWGAACGTFSTALYDKINEFIRHKAA